MYKIIPRVFRYRGATDLTQISAIIQTDSSIEEVVVDLEALTLSSTLLVSEIYPNSSVWDQSSYGIVQDV